ncbi:single-stranded DNA-binding protein [Conexibacter sp. W3-3-2]|uniref:single-stranded DNA-binding protein n=1 Tax=Conexibacter sp. W3-3-2 TaxID=2675227 RepID=UPI0012B8D7F7|nr:single-stranded DNA-binding protein [Conexibacter sp. W3-3-2]MTD47439.1 single-stranded DNA-binding protein [Conexibacter sp. W3-3-2]MTD47578.1 single-stranded DNA-binding protein [Conexibacter sp. W3-3-2]
MLTITGNGRLTRDPELRATKAQKSVTTISVACDQRGRDGETVYVDLVLWERAAEAAVEHLVKGQAVAFAGGLRVRTWADRDGNKRHTVEVHNVDLEYGAKPHRTDDDLVAVPDGERDHEPTDDEIPF